MTNKDYKKITRQGKNNLFDEQSIFTIDANNLAVMFP